MPSQKSESAGYSEDVLDFLILLHKNKVKYVIVGGQAVIYYGHARLTGDIDIYFDNTGENCLRMIKTLNEFWDNNIPGHIQISDLKNKNNIIQFGLPPNRIDLISHLQELEFDKVWKSKETAELEHRKKVISVYFISLEYLIKNKAQTGRPRDLEDLKFLRSLIK